MSLQLAFGHLFGCRRGRRRLPAVCKSVKRMQLNAPDQYHTSTELDAVAALLDIRDARVLELGCGDARTTRALVDRLHAAEVIATEVDQVQHQKNLTVDDLPCVRFRLGGAEAIEAADASFDAVFMFKSLHHVPIGLMDQSLVEIHRVLKPGGAALFSEPVYWGDFNALMSLIHDERRVREAAFAALCRAVDSGLFASEQEAFIQVPGSYDGWDAFSARFLDVTHTVLDIDEQRRGRIRTAFERHLTPTGAHFMKPHRIDLLRKRG
jgi:SAM-dependent methyltransferase